MRVPPGHYLEGCLMVCQGRTAPTRRVSTLKTRSMKDDALAE